MRAPLTKLRTLIVDDSAIIRNRLTTLLSDLPNVEIVGQAANTPQAMQSIRALTPDVVILDIRLPGGSGLEALRDIKRELPATVVIILTNYPYPQYRTKCLADGADFFFDKSTEFQKIAGAIDSLVVLN